MKHQTPRFAPRFIYSNDLRRFIGPMTGEEALLCERFERQRQTEHRVRAYVADPDRKFTRIITAYIQWLQIFIRPGSDAIIDLPAINTQLSTLNSQLSTLKSQLQHSSVFYNSARSPYASHGRPRTALQCIILDADRISSSRPYRDSRLDQMHRHLFGYLPLRCDSVLIIIGDPYRRRRNRFRHHWLRVKHQAATTPDGPYQLIEPADPASAIPIRRLNPPARSHAFPLPHSDTLPLRHCPHSGPLPTAHYPLPTAIALPA